MFPNTHKGAMTPMNLTITNDKPLDHWNLAETKYADVFRGLSKDKNCIVIESGTTMKAVASALRHWINTHHPQDGYKVRSVQKYHADGKPRVWLIYPSGPRTEIRGPFPGRK